MNGSFEKKIVIGAIVALLILAINASISYRATRELLEHQELVAHTNQVLTELEALMSTIKDVESGQRGYFITGDESHLENYYLGLSGARQHLDKIKFLTDDNPKQQARLPELERLIEARLERLRIGIEVRKTGDDKAARELITSGTGKRLMDELRQVVKAMEDEEAALMKVRAEAARASGRYAVLTAVIPNGFAIFSIALIAFLLIRDVTARKRAEQAVRDQRELLRVTLSSVGEGVIATDTKGDVTFINPIAQSLTGWLQSEAQGVPITEVLHIVNEQTRETVDNPALKAIEAGEMTVLASSTLLIATDGREIPIDDSAAPIKDASGKIAGAVLIFRDIAERRSAERAHVLLAGIVESSDDAIVSKTLDGIVDSWNAGAENLFEYKASEIVGKSITLIIPPDRMEEEKEILQKIRDGKRIHHFETVRITKSGKSLDISLTVSPILDGNGKVVGASKIVRDVTARKRAEEAVRQQRELLNVTLASIGDGVVATDTNGIVTFLNPMAEALTGYTSAEAVGRPLTEIFNIKNEDTGTPVENPALRAIKEGVIVGLANHTVLTAKDGTERPIDDSGAPIRDADGRLLGAVLVFRDITERHANEKERAKLLAAEKAAREAAESANRAKDEFVAAISHEIRSPLTAILGWAQMLRIGKFSEADTARAVETIERNAKAQVQLIEDLLDLSRVITGKLDIRVQTIEIADFIETAIDSIRPAAEAKAIAIDVDLGQDRLFVSADPDRFQQILWNLLSNAVKFTPRQGNIWIKIGRHESQAEITIRDSGIGISRDFLPFVFDRFSQESTASQRKYQGLGLGLAIVRHLVELHGGTVRVESEGTDRGTTFVVALPIKAVRDDVVDAARTDAKQTSLESLTDNISLAGVRVMLVDDERETRELLKEILVQRGAEVYVCKSAEEVLEAIAVWKPAVLLSDIGMPDMDGYDLIRALRAHPAEEGGAVPAVALTAYARVEDRMRALTSGYQMQITKPIEAAELATVIASLAGRIVRGK